jgi:hypothetical protein
MKSATKSAIDEVTVTLVLTEVEALGACCNAFENVMATEAPSSPVTAIVFVPVEGLSRYQTSTEYSGIPDPLSDVLVAR